MGSLIVGIFIGILVSYTYANGERELRKTQQNINKSIMEDLKFYKKLSDQYEEELKRKK
jgi:uncharacterized membrane-anchored protein YhcB (DUF1043 family)